MGSIWFDALLEIDYNETTRKEQFMGEYTATDWKPYLKVREEASRWSHMKLSNFFRRTFKDDAPWSRIHETKWYYGETPEITYKEYRLRDVRVARLTLHEKKRP